MDINYCSQRMELFALKNQQPDVWYKDHGGKKNTINMNLQCQRVIQKGDEVDLRDAEIYFEDGKRLPDNSQGILKCTGFRKAKSLLILHPERAKLGPGTFEDITMMFRISKISLSFQHQKFRIKLTPKLVHSNCL